MIRLTNQRGVSLLLLIVMVTVFAGVAIGGVMLLRTRHESYPYQVQSYQAYALAHAGVEFATRYVRDNQSDFISNPALYIPQSSYKSFAFGNGTFELKYVPGCPDALYSRGTCGTATREVKLSSFAGTGGSVYMASVPTRIEYTSAGIYSGSRVEFRYCDPTRFTLGNWSWIKLNSITIAADKPVNIMRVGITKPSFGSVDYEWVWDGACGAGLMGACQSMPLNPGGVSWDGISDPPNASATPTWNCRNPLSLSMDNQCRPRICPVDTNTTCSWYPTLGRTDATCNMGGPFRDLPFGDWQGHIAIETRGTITTQLPVKFYVSFDHGEAGYNVPPGRSPNPNPWIRNTFIFTIDH
jgi:hypothetical protein